MALYGDGIALRLDDPGNNTVQYDASDDRAAFTALQMLGGSGITARAGRRPGYFTVTTGGSPESVSVPPVSGVITDADGGSYLFATTVTVGKTLAARPASGTSRIDIVVARVYDADVHPSDTTKRELDIEVLVGAASANPQEPTIPYGCLRLATLTVPASGTITINTQGPQVVALGGILPLMTSTDRDALTLYDGLMIYRQDIDTFEARLNGQWVTIATGGWNAFTPTPNFTLGNGTLVGYYTQVGKTVHFRLKLTLGSTTNLGTGVAFFNPPVTAAVDQFAVGSAYGLHGSNHSGGACWIENGSIHAYLGSGQITSSNPWTWASGDMLSLSGTYEAA